MDLFIRVDIIRKYVNDFSYNPCGIVLIDEPETHLHLQLQEQVLPLLTRLFPNIRFIAATHSPAVVASIKKAATFDLTTKEADKILKQINKAVEQFNHDPAKLRKIRIIYHPQLK